MAALRFSVSFGKASLDLELSATDTLQHLADMLAVDFDVLPDTIKLLLPARGHAGASTIKPLKQPQTTLARAGFQPGARVKMLASRAEEVEAVRGAREPDIMPGIDHELQRELKRRGVAASGGPPLPTGPYTFQRFEAWQRPGLAPPPGEAMKLLHRLAADPGIVGVMQKHRWAVGLLSEMPPEGKVGISPVCLLGVNVNAGQEISLRLRTDDLKGFRRYDRIRETLLHELAHMVHSEHNNAFKKLNSQLRRECAQLDWQGASGAHSLAGEAYGGSLQYDLPKHPATAMQQTAADSGKTLRQLAGDGGSAAADARQAAAAAALGRAGQVAPPPPPPATQQQQNYAKGDKVLYRQRDGTLVEAKIVAVDKSVLPPSYGIELASGYRETEGHRLQPAPVQQQQGGVAAGRAPADVEGLGHRDAATEATEEAVRQQLE